MSVNLNANIGLERIAAFFEDGYVWRTYNANVTAGERTQLTIVDGNGSLIQRQLFDGSMAENTLRTQVPCVNVPGIICFLNAHGRLPGPPSVRNGFQTLGTSKTDGSYLVLKRISDGTYWVAGKMDIGGGYTIWQAAKAPTSTQWNPIPPPPPPTQLPPQKSWFTSLIEKFDALTWLAIGIGVLTLIGGIIYAKKRYGRRN